MSIPCLYRSVAKVRYAGTAGLEVVTMNVLVVDIGGTQVKVLATGQNQEREFVSGPTLTPKQMVYVADVVQRLIAALEPEDVVLGGGNIHKLKQLPPGCRAGDNANAFLGGLRLWDKASHSEASIPATTRRGNQKGTKG